MLLLSMMSLVVWLLHLRRDLKQKQLGVLVLCLINSTTDRSGTNACVDDLLVKWRDELFPMFFDNFEDLSPQAKKKLTHLNIFKCHLGLLEDMADEANGAHVGI